MCVWNTKVNRLALLKLSGTKGRKACIKNNHNTRWTGIDETTQILSEHFGAQTKGTTDLAEKNGKGIWRRFGGGSISEKPYRILKTFVEGGEERFSL